MWQGHVWQGQVSWGSPMHANIKFKNRWSARMFLGGFSRLLGVALVVQKRPELAGVHLPQAYCMRASSVNMFYISTRRAQMGAKLEGAKWGNSVTRTSLK